MCQNRCIAGVFAGMCYIWPYILSRVLIRIQYGLNPKTKILWTSLRQSAPFQQNPQQYSDFGTWVSGLSIIMSAIFFKKYFFTFLDRVPFSPHSKNLIYNVIQLNKNLFYEWVAKSDNDLFEQWWWQLLQTNYETILKNCRKVGKIVVMEWWNNRGRLEK